MKTFQFASVSICLSVDVGSRGGRGAAGVILDSLNYRYWTNTGGGADKYRCGLKHLQLVIPHSYHHSYFQTKPEHPSIK